MAFVKGRRSFLGLAKPHIRLHARISGAWGITVTAHGFKPVYHGHYHTVHLALADARVIIDHLRQDRFGVTRMFRAFEHGAKRFNADMSEQIRRIYDT